MALHHELFGQDSVLDLFLCKKHINLLEGLSGCLFSVSHNFPLMESYWSIPQGT